MSEVDKIIKEIEEIQKQSYQNSISAMVWQLKVDNLHAKLDELGYKGERPPRSWSQLNPEGKYCYKHPEELMDATGLCKLCKEN
jgi:hypothetical protein